MKSNSLTMPASGSQKHVQVFNPLAWESIARMYNYFPKAVTPCKNVYEAKMYTAALLAVLSICFLPLVIAACWVYFSAKKGGQV